MNGCNSQDISNRTVPERTPEKTWVSKNARSQLTDRGPLGFGPMKKFDGCLCSATLIWRFFFSSQHCHGSFFSKPFLSMVSTATGRSLKRISSSCSWSERITFYRIMRGVMWKQPLLVNHGLSCNRWIGWYWLSYYNWSNFVSWYWSSTVTMT